MLCSTYEEHLNFFLDGRLSVDTQIELFKHLAACAECRDFVEKTNRFRSAARKEEIAYPEKLDRTIFEEISRRKRVYTETPRLGHLVASWRKPVTMPRFAFAAMVFFVLLLGGLEIHDRVSTKLDNHLNPPATIPAYQMISPNVNPVGVIYIIAQPVPVESVKPFMPDTTFKKGAPHEPQSPAVAAFISLWSAVLERDGYCAG
jgi:hypothetical protein